MRLPGGKRQRGAWWIQYFCARGHRHREEIGPRDLATTAVAKRRALVRGDGYCPQIERERRKQEERERVTLDELIGLVLRDYEDSGRAAAQRIREYRTHLVEHFGKRRSARDLTTREIDKYKDRRLKEGLAPATINRELACLRRAFRLGREKGMVAPNEVPVTSLFSEHNVRTGFLEEHELRKLIPLLSEDLRPLVTFLHLTGWRLGEALVLQWSQVDFRAGVVRLEAGTTKNREGRTFPFAVLPELEVMLREQRDRTRVHERARGQIVRWVFHRRGDPIHRLPSGEPGTEPARRSV